MPTYEYECKKCKKKFEVFQSMKDEPLKTCPDKKCKGRVHRLIGAGAGFIFKGSGFYITDYRSENYKKAAQKESGESKPKTEKSTDKPSTASKPEKKSSEKSSTKSSQKS